MGIRHDSLKEEFVWPEPYDKRVKAMDLIDLKATGRRTRADLSDKAKARLDSALQHITEAGGNPRRETWFIDVDASEEFVTWAKEPAVSAIPIHK